MKLNLFILVLFILPLSVKANTSFGAYKIVDGKVKACDSCYVPMILNIGEIVDYMILGAQDELEDAPPMLDKYSNSKFPHISRYLTVSGSFSLDFLVDDYWSVGSADNQKWLQKKRLEFKPLQFSVLRNNVLIKNWTDISTLGNDKEFQPYKKKDNEEALYSNNFHAGNFQLNHDSLTVLIRSSVSKQIVQSILIKRKFYFPGGFDFIKFSSDLDLQDILNNRFNKDGGRGFYHRDSVETLEMEPDQIAALRFMFEHQQILHYEIEYGFVRDQTVWKTLFTKEDNPFQTYSYIIINKPAPGKTIELLLRYKQQPESVHRIIIKVHEKFASTTFFKIAATLIVAGLLFAIWYAFKRRNHQKQLKQITLNKEEIESKLQLLSGQLNPHFLFNSLNSVQNLINKHDTENANLYVSEVSSFLRIIMDAGKKEYISLEEELNMEEAYIKLEQKRKAFYYSIINNCSINLSQIEFPPSLLQPVIENSIHHGFSRNIGNPLITINISCNEKQLIVLVTDNGKGFDAALIKPSHGLAIVQKRISLMNEKLSGMPIEMKVTSRDKGTVTTFTFQNWL